MQDHFSHVRIISKCLQRLILSLLSLYVLSSCTLPDIPSSNPQSPTQTISPTPIPQETLITFRLTLDQPIPPGQSLMIHILDEVSGLAFNVKDYVMTAEDANHFTVILPFRLGAVVKYRYARQGDSTIQEHLSDGRPVRYRLYHVEGPGIVQDTISRWTDTNYSGTTGRITGQIKNAINGQPIPNLLITAGGAQVLTRADGSFMIEGLPPGIHNLVAYAMDGRYNTYQQGANVVSDSTTPASFNLSPTTVVPVVFYVTVPETTPLDATLRMAGNLSQLGNTYADLAGGVSVLASKMPVLTRMPDGRYTATINLPVGVDIEYKYSLGDGLWNAEHSADGTMTIRHLTISETTPQLTDTVANWGTIQMAPIRFDVTVPAHTLASEGVSIQFNPGFGWLQPLPMWQALSPQGSPIWRFVLISPLEVLETIQYRICRADQCGIADDTSTQGSNPIGHIVSTGVLPQTILYSVSDWVWYPGTVQQANIPNITILPRGSEFVAGIGFDPSYHPSWGLHVNDAIDVVKNLGANWLIFSPSWSFTRIQPPVLEISPSQDITLPDLSSYANHADNIGLKMGIYPTPHFPVHPDQWWYDAPRDFSWWVVWFDHYAQYMLHHAELSSQLNVDALILGGDWITPALPAGKLENGSPSNVPEDADFRWRTLIEQIRDRYHGTLVWAMSYPEGHNNQPAFIDSVDKIMIHWSAPLSSAENPSVQELYAEAARILDQEILPIAQSTGKSIILAVEYPSAHGSAAGCIHTSDGECLPASSFSTTYPDFSEVSLDLQDQADLYNGLFMAVNEREWVNGLISMGFYPPVTLQDPSISTYSKPAAGVLWYWFPRLIGLQQ